MDNILRGINPREALKDIYSKRTPSYEERLASIYAGIFLAATAAATALAVLLSQPQVQSYINNLFR